MSQYCAFFLAAENEPGTIVEQGPTEKMFSEPDDPRTLDYVTRTVRMMRLGTCVAGARRARAVARRARAVPVAPAARRARRRRRINGAGSTWSQIALDQWRADVARQGLSVNYQGVGSTSGRVFYYQDQVDFAASEIPFTPAYRDATGTVDHRRGRSSPRTGRTRTCPIVAGGTSFMYHLDDQRAARHEPAALARRRSRRSSPASSRTGTTRRSPPTTRSCTLPNLPIRPVVRSDGSGTTAQFTAFMASQTPGDLERVLPAGRDQRRTRARRCRCGPTSTPTAQQFSDGVADLRRRAVQQRCDHLRRVRLREAARLPGRVAAEQGGLLHAADPAQRRDRAAGRDAQPRPHAEPRAACTRTPTRARTRCRATAT